MLLQELVFLAKTPATCATTIQQCVQHAYQPHQPQFTSTTVVLMQVRAHWVTLSTLKTVHATLARDNALLALRWRIAPRAT